MFVRKISTSLRSIWVLVILSFIPFFSFYRNLTDTFILTHPPYPTTLQKSSTCSSFTNFSFSPTRKRTKQNIKVIVPILLGRGKLDLKYRLGPRWQSWVQYFLIDPDLHLLLLINADMPLTIEETARDLNLTKTGKNFHGESVFSTTSASPVLIQRVQLIPPAWVVKSGKTNSDMYLSDWESHYCNADYHYNIGNKFYCYQVFTLDLMRHYDYFVKIDTDIRFTNKAPIIEEIMSSLPVFIHTAILNGSSTSCYAGHLKYIESYAQEKCRSINARRQPWFEQENTMCYGNFVGGWLGFHTSPEALEYMWRFFNEEQGWIHRWADQALFLKLHGMFFPSLSNVMDLGRWRYDVFVHKK